METATHTASAGAESHGDHPTEKTYLGVAAVLAVLTAIEVGLYYVTGLSDGLLTVMLVVLAVAKFVIVVGYFMHLKYDNPIFRQLMIVGVGLALACYAAVLFSMKLG